MLYAAAIHCYGMGVNICMAKQKWKLNMSAENGKLLEEEKWFYDYMWKQVMWTDGYKLLWLLLFSVISFLSLEWFFEIDL